MGKVLAIMKIMPEDATAPISELRDQLDQALKGKAHIEAWEEVPIFGPLSALRLRFIVEDEAGGTAAVEELVKKVPGVSELEIEAVSLL
jgi:translation elongation factor aEF-1 beta